MFNNQVYGLTKGQFSPTSKLGQVTKTSPTGVAQRPVNPIQFALGCGASFVARSIDKDPAHMSEIFQAAYAHQGCSFVEIYQDCHVFNSGAFDAFSTKTQRQEGVLYLQSQMPMTFGETPKALISTSGNFEVTHNTSDAEIHQLNHFAHASSLARLEFPEFPVPVGVFYQEDAMQYANPSPSFADSKALMDLYKKGAYWSRKPD